MNEAAGHIKTARAFCYQRNRPRKRQKMVFRCGPAGSAASLIGPEFWTAASSAPHLHVPIIDHVLGKKRNKK